jgi:hypothetical protein
MQEKLDVMSRDILDVSEAVADLAQSTDERFTTMDRRFEAVDRRFDTLERRINASESKILNKLDELFSSRKGDEVGVARAEVKRHEAHYHAVS